MADPTYCPWLINAPCLKPEVWAAWAQTILSIAAAALALYVPVRMKRLEELDRIDNALEVAGVLCEQYIAFIRQHLPTYAQGTDLPNVPAEIVALDADLAVRATTSSAPFLMPDLVRMSSCSSEIIRQWNNFRELSNKNGPHFIARFEGPIGVFEKRLIRARNLRKNWRRKHRLSLALKA
ncbi:hypothetical protein [Xanthomonas citri]|uniref:hypothetical protein n=1 Tax=Xanthomonas citri TaxID=346 RepID=UPI002711DE53|nr:hypothetical protein [Xanthomonas citri]WLA27590.1 hypothetical protein NPS81_11645 [Xanthomonas citri pv. glycines]